MNRVLKSIFAVTMVAVMSLPLSVSAASHDTIEDISTDTATFTVGKNIIASQVGRFPNMSDYTFEIEAIKAWSNANSSTSENGRDIFVSEIPMPIESSVAHHRVTVDGTKAIVAVGDFRSAEGTTDKADTERTKFRTTDVNIKYAKAGYYMYKITEKYDADNRVPGVVYDDNSYYMVVYVCNKTDAEGNTIEGVYVHDITSYRNDTESDSMPDLSDIANVTDNGGVGAIANTYENFEKVGKSNTTIGTDPDTGILLGPNKLEAYKFWNSQTTHDVVITNNVTGNLGDITKEFEFEIVLSGLEKNTTYTTNIDAEEKTEKNHTSMGVVMVAGDKGTVNSDSFTSDENGEVTFKVKLRDDEVFVMNALPASSCYVVTEAASDHIASYGVSSTREETAIIENIEAANIMDNTSLATAVETVDSASNVEGMPGSEDNDGTITIAFTNHRSLATITGLPYYGEGMFVLGIFLILSVMVFAALRRYERGRQEDFE